MFVSLMNCDPCNKACKLPLCAYNINLGRIEAFDTDVIVVITELITGRKQAIQATSDEAGNLIIAITDEIHTFFSPNFIYSIAVFSSVSNDCPDTDLIINDISVPCVQVEFFVCDGIDTETSVLSLQNQTDYLLDENSDPLLDEQYNPLQA